MSEIRTVKKFVTTDGAEFSNVEDARKHQDLLDSSLKGLKHGDEVRVVDLSSHCVSAVIISYIVNIDPPFATLAHNENLTKSYDVYLPKVAIFKT